MLMIYTSYELRATSYELRGREASGFVTHAARLS